MEGWSVEDTAAVDDRDRRNGVDHFVEDDPLEIEARHPRLIESRVNANQLLFL